MIIWGSTGKEKVIGHGVFFCPRCAGQTSYFHIRLARYFTLYFIPLFRTQTVGEFVQCRQCSGQFKPEILQVPPEQIQAMLQPWQCESCGNNNPADHGACLGCGAPRMMGAPEAGIAPHEQLHN